jgi:hypothetical protein
MSGKSFSVDEDISEYHLRRRIHEASKGQGPSHALINQYVTRMFQAYFNHNTRDIGLWEAI